MNDFFTALSEFWNNLKIFRLHSKYYSKIAITLLLLDGFYYAMFMLTLSQTEEGVAKYVFILLGILLCIVVFGIYCFAGAISHMIKISRKQFDMTRLNKHLIIYDLIYIAVIIAEPILRKIFIKQ